MSIGTDIFDTFHKAKYSDINEAVQISKERSNILNIRRVYYGREQMEMQSRGP